MFGESVLHIMNHFNTKTQYELIDFEEFNIYFYCNEIKIKVIAVGGKMLNVNTR